MLHGTTTMVGSGWASGMLRNPDAGTNGMEGGPLADVNNETFPLGDSNETQRSDCDWDFRDETLDVAQDEAYVPHVAEGINDRAAEEFFCLSRQSDGGEDVTEANTAHIHSMGLQAEDYYRMALDDAQIVWSPRSNISLYGDTARVTTFHALGGTLALGTDWSYSGSIAQTRELACADQLNGDHFGNFFTDTELWRMATSNAAKSIGSGDVIGSLAAGYLGDVAVFDGTTHRGPRAVIEALSRDIALVLRSGEPLYGEAPVLGSLGEACDPIDVCGEERVVCSSREFGKTYSELAGDMDDDAYPVAFCDTPTNEPTCLPSRPGQYSSPSADDTDGDGQPNATDGCPDVFDPIRPMDDGAAPDADGDGTPDACDPTPVGTDLDDDGIDNSDDNCPLDENDAQDDADMDGVGDTCDYCPDLPNLGGICPAGPADEVSIAALRTTVALGTTVSVNGVVIGVGSSGYAVQDPTIAGGTNAGVYVYTGGSPTVERGDAVTVTGELDEFFDELQISQDSVSVTGTGTVTPTVLTPSEAAQEVYEGVLVQVDGEVTDDDYDCSQPPGGSGCSDTGLWQIGGASGVVVYDRYYEDSDWAAQIGETPVVGVMGFRWGTRRLMPSTASDFGTP